MQAPLPTDAPVTKATLPNQRSMSWRVLYVRGSRQKFSALGIWDGFTQTIHTDLELATS